MIQDLNIFNIENFQKHKNVLIDLISKIPQTPLISDGIDVEHSDWEVTPKMKREYIDYFKKHIFEDFAKDICKNFNCESLTLLNMWFQIYGKNGHHSMHRHGNAHFTNIVFLNLPNKNLITKIYDLKNNVVDIRIEEGHILTFPAYLKHESSFNKSDEKKIILSYNISIEN